MTDPLAFWDSLLARGIELRAYGNGLHLWPTRAKPHLTDAERDYLFAHRAELKRLIRIHGQRETFAVWAPGSDTSLPPGKLPDASEPDCPFCQQALLLCDTMRARRLENWRALHYFDPAEIARRDQAATDEMFESLRRYGRYGY